MTIFENAKSRTGPGEAKRRARIVSKSIRQLLETNNEKEFIEGLEKDFGITPDHPNYAKIIAVWKGARENPPRG